MPDTAYTPPAFQFSDSDRKSIIQESLDRALLTRQNILAKPKPTYNIDGQEFKWNEYLDTLNKTIAELTSQLQAFDELYEIDSQLYT